VTDAERLKRVDCFWVESEKRFYVPDDFMNEEQAAAYNARLRATVKGLIRQFQEIVRGVA